MNKQSLFLAAAVSGLMFAGATASADHHEGAHKGAKKAAKEVTGECHGVNACKGQGACHGADHDCAGKNECTGQAWTTMTKKECKKAGGKFTKS